MNKITNEMTFIKKNRKKKTALSGTAEERSASVEEHMKAFLQQGGEIKKIPTGVGGVDSHKGS